MSYNSLSFEQLPLTIERSSVQQGRQAGKSDPAPIRTWLLLPILLPGGNISVPDKHSPRRCFAGKTNSGNGSPLFIDTDCVLRLDHNLCVLDRCSFSTWNQVTVGICIPVRSACNGTRHWVLYRVDLLIYMEG